MIRTCDGTDPNLLMPFKPAEADGPTTVTCTCGLIFDDVERMVIWPHHAIRPSAQVAAAIADRSRGAKP